MKMWKKQERLELNKVYTFNHFGEDYKAIFIDMCERYSGLSLVVFKGKYGPMLLRFRKYSIKDSVLKIEGHKCFLNINKVEEEYIGNLLERKIKDSKKN